MAGERDPNQVINIKDEAYWPPGISETEQKYGVAPEMRRKVFYADGHYDVYSYDPKSPPPADATAWGRQVPGESGIDRPQQDQWLQVTKADAGPSPKSDVTTINGVPYQIVTNSDGTKTYQQIGGVDAKWTPYDIPGGGKGVYNPQNPGERYTLAGPDPLDRRIKEVTLANAEDSSYYKYLEAQIAAGKLSAEGARDLWNQSKDAFTQDYKLAVDLPQTVIDSQRQAYTARSNAAQNIGDYVYKRDKAATDWSGTAVDDALKGMRYRGSPAWNNLLTAGFNGQLSARGGDYQVTPDAFATRMPDLSTVRRTAYDEAMGRLPEYGAVYAQAPEPPALDNAWLTSTRRQLMNPYLAAIEGTRYIHPSQLDSYAA